MITLKLVSPKRLKQYGKLVKAKDGSKTLYLPEGIHVTTHPLLDGMVKKQFNSN